MKILWISTVETPGQELQRVPEGGGLEIETTADGWEALERLQGSQFGVVVASLPVPDWSAPDLLEQIQRVRPEIPVIIRTPDSTLSEAARFIKLGAYSCIDSREDPATLALLLEEAVEYQKSRELASLSSALQDEPWRGFLVGESGAMRNVARLVRLIGPRRSTVLISGETGAGKELVARAIHAAGNRSHLPMVAVNCSALPENLLEAELFGHVRGAFTGAVNQRIGRFEQANHSTLFLDEVGDMPLNMQSKLLRVLQEREFQRVGSSENIKVDVRVLAASNIDLAQAVEQGKFREDLFYRLNVVPIRVPSLRERPTDIPLLVHHFLSKICRGEEMAPRRIAGETLGRLMSYSWPGNVRQLENAVEMAIALSGDREMLYPGDFPLPFALPARSVPTNSFPSIALPDEGLDFEQIVSHMERTILEQALRRTGGNKAQAAEMLRLKRTTLSAKLKSLAPLADPLENAG
jgi:DNA-binding NtrC family response regulator